MRISMAAFSFFALLTSRSVALEGERTKGLIVKNRTDCNALSQSISKDNITTTYPTDIEQIKSRYTLVKEFSSGKSGAYVALVKASNGDKKVLKIYPSVADSKNKYAYRELFYTCQNTFIAYEDLGFKIDNNPYASAFPVLYEVGVTTALNLDMEASPDATYPYMIFEFVQGKSLAELGEQANADETIDSTQPLRLFSKMHPHSEDKTTSEYHRRAEYVTYEIIHMLSSTFHLQIDGKEYGFYHADLNPGNVFVRNKLVSGTYDAGYGQIPFKDVPMITLIDFGHSTSNLDAKLGANVKSIKTQWQSLLKFDSKSLNKFYKDLNGIDLTWGYELGTAFTTWNSDIRLFQQTAKAIIDSGNFVNQKVKNTLTSCSSRSACVKEAPKAFKAP